MKIFTACHIPADGGRGIRGEGVAKWKNRYLLANQGENVKEIFSETIVQLFKTAPALVCLFWSIQH